TASGLSVRSVWGVKLESPVDEGRGRRHSVTGMIALRGPLVVGAQGGSVAVLAKGRLKLVELGITLAGEFSLRGFAVEFGTRAIVERGVKVDPDLGIGITLGLRGGRRFCQAQTDQHAVPCR